MADYRVHCTFHLLQGHVEFSFHMSRVQPSSQHDNLFSENDVSLHHVRVKLARHEGTMFLQDFSRKKPLISD